MGRRREPAIELTQEDWCALCFAMKLFEQIALYGSGRRTLIWFAKAILKGEEADNG